MRGAQLLFVQAGAALWGPALRRPALPVFPVAAIAAGKTRMAAAAPAAEPTPTAQLAAFALPVLLPCMAEPLLSMIDTIFVGRAVGGASTAALAALGVNVAIYNVIATSTAFLCTATTGIVGSLPADSGGEGGGDDGMPGTARVFANGMLMAAALGAVICVATQLACGPLLARFYHLDRGSEAYQMAERYLRIRALAAPASTVTLVGAGVAFGMGDSRTPALAACAAVAFNLAGDLLLVPRLGLDGAAIATAAASAAGALTLAGALAKRLQPAWRRPRLSELAPFLRFSAPLLAGTLLASLAYSATTSVVAAGRSLTDIAAHQVALQGWWLLSFAAVPLSLAAQSLLPPLARGNGPRPLAWDTSRAAITLGAALALPLAAANWLLCARLAGLFVSDAAVAAQLRAIAAPAAISQFAITLATALDGVYIGCGALGHYLHVVAVSTGSLAILFGAALATGRAGLTFAWTGLLLFSAIRCAAHACRLRALREDLCSGPKDLRT